MSDAAMTADDILLALEPLALLIGRRHPRQDGIERDDLIGEAWIALHDLAPKYVARDVAIDEPPMEKWFAKHIREHLRSYVRKTLWGFLEGVPPRLRRRAITAHTATERLKARGILRPSYEQIAGEAKLSLDVILLIAVCPRVIQRQGQLEWAEDKSGTTGGEPTLVPLFPIVYLTPDSKCPHGHWEHLDKGFWKWVPSRELPKDSTLCCMVCHRSGRDGHPALKRNRATDPKPEPQPTAMPAEVKPAAKETRVQRRARLFPPQETAPAA